MAMVQLPTVDDLLGITNGGTAKTFWEAWLNFTGQSVGGAAAATVTIAGGVISVSQCLNEIDTEGGAAADDLTNIDTTGIPNGTVIAIACSRADHVPTVKHGVAGAGRILLSDATDYALSATTKVVLLRLRGADWVELARSLAGDLGTAAKKNTGTAAGNVPLLGGQGLPGVSGELLTDIPRIGNFAPSQQPSPNMTLAIAAGSILIGTALTKVAAQNTATIAAPVLNSRNDIVYVDATTGAVGVAQGVENASPADPAVPAGKVPVARLRLATTTTAIKSAIIDDIRQLGGASNTASAPGIVRRQTIVGGPISAGGASNFGGATGGTTVTVAGTIILTAAGGYDANGKPVDRVGKATNPQWTGLNVNGTMFLMGRVNADGTWTPVSLSLAPVEQDAGVPATTNGQHTFNIKEMAGYLGSGGAAPQDYLVKVGEVTVAGGVVTAIVWYAVGAAYDSGRFSISPSTSYAKAHNIGYQPRVLKLQGASGAGGVLNDFKTFYTGGYYGAYIGLVDRKSATVIAEQFPVVATAPSSAPTAVEADIFIDRGW